MLKKFLNSQLSGLAPWIVFSLSAGPERLEESVLLALATAVVLFVLNLVEDKTFKALELSDVVFFSGLAIVIAIAGEDTLQWLEIWANELSNMAFVMIAVGSILVRRPFTLAYARETVDPSQWNDPDFIRCNYVVTTAWAVAFTVAATSGAYGDAILKNSNELWTGWIIQTLALIWAAQFTAWYTRRARALGRAADGLETDPPPPVSELVKSVTGYALVDSIVQGRRKARR